MYKEIIKCSQYDIMRVKPKSGQMYFTVDSRTLYKDYGNNIEQRMSFNAVILISEYQRLNSIKPVVGKFYYVEESNCLWLFDTRWILKIGDGAEYNAYTANSYISPVINKDSLITGKNGDKILDNNGLLGDGSVVVRDSNRIIRGLFSSDVALGNTSIKSYLDNGLIFIPNAHLPYTDLSTSLGALHLTVEKNDISDDNSIDLNGSAYYYGNWNTYGSMFIVQKDTIAGVYADYVPINDYELIKFYITSQTVLDDVVTKNHFVIRPLSDSSALVHVLSINNEHNNSVVQNDMGELIFTNIGEVLENNTFECTRKISSSGEYYISEYNLERYGETITIKQHKSNLILEAIIPKIWNDDSDNISINVNKWTKDKVLTMRDVETLLKDIQTKLK